MRTMEVATFDGLIERAYLGHVVDLDLSQAVPSISIQIDDIGDSQTYELELLMAVCFFKVLF